ncbi:hypothetical protein BDW74DRAFT_34187 [Aspergillus multicolor]|uniref:uncharacterized protein n=1 Tax=Aspergillus multicolor TaxID=41759 RepID=UPI003CCD146B
MKLPFFLLLSYLVAYVSAYAMPGAYERILYYYAYKLDCAINGEPKTVGARCGPNCSFNEFLSYIDEDLRVSKTQLDITSDEFPDVDRTAKKLESLDITGVYTPDTILPGKGLTSNGADIPRLIDGVAKFIRQNIDEVSDKTIKQGILRSSNRALFYRRHATSKEIQRSIKIDWDTTTKELRFGDGTRQSFTFIDVRSTVEKMETTMPDLETRVKKLHDTVHDGNVDALKTLVRAANQC